MVFPKELAMSSTNKNDDCYFYFYSSCNKGEECPYRHCQLALGTETVCSLWKEGRCFRSNCKFRHMESRIDRSNIPCYWENQPSGCRKPHCVFFHRKLKNGARATVEKQGLIMPISTSPTPTAASDVKTESPSPVLNAPHTENIPDETDEGIHSPVEPFVVSFDENEESDSESVSSTPVKPNDSKPLNSQAGKSNLLSRLSEKPAGKILDFEIKSLEQIRLEKIHKESANFYKTDDDLPGSENFFHDKKHSPMPSESLFNYSADYEVPSLDEYKMKRSLETEQNYPPSSDFVSLQPDQPLDTESTVHNKDITQSSLKQETDLRNLLSQSKKKTSTNAVHKNPLDFKIKTLDEIRKEKKLKTISPENGESADPSCRQTISISRNPAAKKLRINRRLITPSNRTEEASSSECMKTETSSQMITQEVETIAEDEISNHEIMDDQEVPLVTGKRKSVMNDEIKSNKFLKLDSSEHSIHLNVESIQQKEDSEKGNVGSLLPFLRHTPTKSNTSPKANDNPHTVVEVNSHPETDSKLSHETNSTLPLVTEVKPSPSIDSDLFPETDSNLTLETDSEMPSETDVIGQATDNLTPSDNSVESSIVAVEADSSAVMDCKEDQHTTQIVKKVAGHSAKSVNTETARSLSMDDIDHFLKDTDVDMGELEDNPEEAEDDIMLKINEFLDS